MPPESAETRTHYSPRTGTKVVLLVALVMIIGAIYAALMPLSVQASNGTTFGCGSAIKPNNSDFGRNYCKDADRGGQYRAVAIAASGLAVLGVGSFLFGFDSTTRTRKARPGFDDGYDDDEDDTPTPRRRSRATREEADEVDDIDEAPKKRTSADRSQRRRPTAEHESPRRVEREPDAVPAGGAASVEEDLDDTAGDDDRSGEDRSGSSLRRSFSDRTKQRGRRRIEVDDDLDGTDYDDDDAGLDDDVDRPRNRR